MLYGEKLKYLREEKEKKQIELSSLISVHEFVYGQYEREYVIIPLKHLNTVCNYFDVSIDYIFGFNETKNYLNSKNEIYLKIVALRLKEFRKENKLTQETLATILKIGRTTITEYERGTNLIATPFLYTICKKYKVSADYLLGKIDSPKYIK